MTEFNQIVAAGRQILDEWLTLTQRKRGPSDDPQLSFIVDGVLALLRPWPDPLNSWDLFWLADYGKIARESGRFHLVFFVGNIKDPKYSEIFEVPSTAFEGGNGRPENHSNWVKSRFGNPDDFRQANAVDSPMDTVFRSTPAGWGLRGDPILWAKLHGKFKRNIAPDSEEEFHARLESLIKEITGENLNAKDKDMVFVPQIYEQSSDGSSSGMVSFDFWRETAIPLLCARFRQRVRNEQNP